MSNRGRNKWKPSATIQKADRGSGEGFIYLRGFGGREPQHSIEECVWTVTVAEDVEQPMRSRQAHMLSGRLW